MSEYIISDEQIAENRRLHGKKLLVMPEIVRCRDCKYSHHEPDWQPDKRRKPFDLWLCEAEWCEGLDGENPWVKPDGFCAWGERKVVGE